MFAYCGNNPVARADNSGNFWNIVAGAVIGSAISVATQIVTNVVTGNKWSSGIGLAAISGAVSGGLAASGVPLVGQVVGNAIISGVSEGVNQYKVYKDDPSSFSLGNAALSIGTATILGGVAGAIGGKGARAPGSSYKWALDNLDDVTRQVASKSYSASTSAKLLSRAQGLVGAVGRSTTIETSLRFYAGAKVAQYGMALLNELIS